MKGNSVRRKENQAPAKGTILELPDELDKVNELTSWLIETEPFYIVMAMLGFYHVKLLLPPNHNAKGFQQRIWS